MSPSFIKCLLSLTSSKKYKEWNICTLHRAAPGLSEHVDSVALVVSGETGGISKAESVDLTFDIAKDQPATIFGSRLPDT